MDYNEYADNIYRIKRKHTTDRHLKKAQSQSILINDCPWCDLEWKCYEKSRHQEAERLCMRRSTETLRIWLYVNDIKPQIKIGNTYGILTVIKFDHKDKKGKLFYSCKCQCGRSIIVRSDNLLGGNTTSCGCLRGKRNKMLTSRTNNVLGCKNTEELTELTKLYGNSVKVGSMMNPDHTRHVPATEHHSKVGQKINKICRHEDKECPENSFWYYDDTRCDLCGGLLRTNGRAERECENCHVIA